METPKTEQLALIGKSVSIKGDVTGSEDLYIDGQVDGTIELHGNNLTIGPNGKVHANVNAKGVVIHGKMEGNIRATGRTALGKSAVTVGDIVTQHISIEDGAYFKGKVEIQREGSRQESTAAATTVGSGAPASAGASK